MKKIYFILSCTLLFVSAAFSQTHFRKGFDITFDVTGTIPSRDLSFNKAPWLTTATFTGGATACSGGMKHLTKTEAGGASQSMLNLDNGQALDIDFGLYPYVTLRIQSTANTDIQIACQFSQEPSKTFTVKGGGAWTIVRLDYSNQKPFPGGTSNEMKWSWTEPGTTTYPYEIYIDYIRLGGVDDKGTGATGNTGDPDSTVKLGITQVTPSPQVFEKDAGEQTITLSGLTNGIDVSNLSLSQTNTKGSLFEGVPTFDAIQPDGTAGLKFTSKTGTIGSTNMQVLLTYNRGDSIIKYKSIWFDINIVTDPKMTVPLTVNGQMNQPKVNIKITAGTNSIGGSSKLGILATSTNTDLITNLRVDGDTIKSDGTATLSFIPGLDKCGSDTITAVLTDNATTRSKEYKICVNITDPSNLCVPDDLMIASLKPVLEVYPNPAEDKATITLPGDGGSELTITDLTGRIVKQVAVPVGQKEIILDLNGIPGGIYNVSVTNGALKSTKKLIIK